jgi:hypothetical protein
VRIRDNVGGVGVGGLQSVLRRRWGTCRILSFGLICGSVGFSNVSDLDVCLTWRRTS